MSVVNNVVLRRRSVEAFSGLSRSTLYAYIKSGNFPKPIRLGAKSVGWLRTDCENWLNARIAATRQADLNGGV